MNHTVVYNDNTRLNEMEQAILLTADSYDEFRTKYISGFAEEYFSDYETDIANLLTNYRQKLLNKGLIKFVEKDGRESVYKLTDRGSEAVDQIRRESYIPAMIDYLNSEITKADLIDDLQTEKPTSGVMSQLPFDLEEEYMKNLPEDKKEQLKKYLKRSSIADDEIRRILSIID